MSGLGAKVLVNPISLSGCVARGLDREARLLDVSFVRIVVEEIPEWAGLEEKGSLPIDLHLDRYRFSAGASVQAKGEGWLRLGLDRVVPSARASLRSFLSPRKIGESLQEDWRTEESRHFHGLNESELWFDLEGGLFFSYLDPDDPELQLALLLRDRRARLQVGTLLRKEYAGLNIMEGELPLQPLPDNDIYDRVGECRDIITNFRPVGQTEFQLKQRLLLVISEFLYSTVRGGGIVRPSPTVGVRVEP